MDECAFVLCFSMEAQFTETMRNMLTGQKPVVEESHCPRCSRKRYAKFYMGSSCIVSSTI
jgi:hypothetical protein